MKCLYSDTLKVDLDALMALKDHGKTPGELERNLRLAQEGTLLLDEYFRGSPDSDVAFILQGALEFDYMIHNYSNRNIMLFTPASSYQLRKRDQAFEGKLRPQNPLLLFDSDMLTGDTIRQAKAFFEDKGYKKENMHVYLHIGLTFNPNWPVLKQVNDMLDYQNKEWPPEIPRLHKPGPIEIAQLRP